MAKVIHFEIPAGKPERAIKFYKNVFGWKINKYWRPSQKSLGKCRGPQDGRNKRGGGDDICG